MYRMYCPELSRRKPEVEMLIPAGIRVASFAIFNFQVYQITCANMASSATVLFDL